MVLRVEAIGSAMTTSLAASNPILFKDSKKLNIQKFQGLRSSSTSLSLFCTHVYSASPSVASSLFPPPPVSLANNPESGISRFLIHGDDVFRKRIAYHPLFYLSASTSIAFAVERDSPQFEIDPEKAREALQDLDQQLESLSEKQRSTPKIKPSGMKLGRTQMREEMPEISETFLVYSALALFIFSILYNVLFYAIIKPAIDGQEIAPPSPPVEEIPKAAVLQQLSSLPSYFRDFPSMANP